MIQWRLVRCLLVLVIAWFLVAYRYDSTEKLLAGNEQRVLLLTAHPDDECMFFAPTILSLIQNSVALYSLCLSVGDADGLGSTRERELSESLRVLGIPSERSRVVDHPLLQDNFTQAWSPEVVAEVVSPFIVAHNITAILTFDEHGISKHPNHISLLKGVSYLLNRPVAPSIQLFTLTTVPILHKYTGPLSALLTKLWLWLPWTPSDCLTYVADLGSYLTALHAMYKHQTQLIWFRWLYVLFSRYMWVNQWVEVRIHVDR